MAREIPHKGGRTFGYRVSHDGSSIAYLSDHDPVALGEGPEGFGAYHAAALALAGGVDVLIHDSQYLEDEWPARANFGHSTPSYAIGLARAAGARSLLMFHHSPTRTDDQLDALTEQWQSEPSLEVRAAAEGEVIDVAAGDH